MNETLKKAKEFSDAGHWDGTPLNQLVAAALNVDAAEVVENGDVWAGAWLDDDGVARLIGQLIVDGVQFDGVPFGAEAIAVAAAHDGIQLNRYADPTSAAAEDITAEEAEEICADDPALVFVTRRGDVVFEGRILCDD